MKRRHLCLILPLTLVTVWTGYQFHRALQRLPDPFLAVIETLHAENVDLHADLAARQHEFDELARRMAALNADLHALMTGPVAAQQSPPVLQAGDRHTLQLASYHDSDSNPAVAQMMQFANDAPQAPAALMLNAAPEQYWQEIQQTAGNILSQKERTQFLQDGSALIQQLEETLAALRIEMEAIDFYETKAASYDLDDILKLNNAQQNIAEKLSLARQFQRDIETLLHPYSQPVRSAHLRGSLTPNFDLSFETQEAARYSHLRADNDVTITQNQHFLITIHFFVTDATTEPPRLVNVTDVFNLNTMQSTSNAFFYPDYFVNDIYELVRKMWRNQGITWNRQPTSEDLQVFLTVINQ